MRILLLLWLFLIPLFQVLEENNLILVYGQAGQCREDQRSLLLQFKKELNSTNSTNLLNWNNNQNCCSWDGVDCDSSGHVISLDLNNETIFSGIENSSSSLFRFQYLERLNLAFNNFKSIQIPSGIGNFKNLTYLNLSNAGFVGQIPTELGRMTRLVTLDLSTRFSGIERLKLENPNLGTLVQNLTELTSLYLDGVNISGPGIYWCNALSSLSNLKFLSLSDCYLSGPIDSSLSKLLSLSSLKLDFNNLSTTVPEFFADFSNLTFLSLGSCNMQGQFPEKIFQVPTLQSLDLSHNSITGSLPQFTESRSFTRMVLSQTNFSGTLPHSIGNLVSLVTIDLSNCNFSGPIPPTMANLKELVYLDFSWNNFSGKIPSFPMSRKLKYLDLSHNYLRGPISSNQFEGLIELANFNLAYNFINGSIPASLFALPSLQKLLLSNNQFDGQVNDFSNASASLLDTLDLSSNQLKGSIPKSFFELERLNVLSLSSNQFNGTIQLEMVGGIPNLTKLELSYNNLSVDVKSNTSISTFPQFTVLKLASCNLKEFPDLRNQSRMFNLDLSDNKIKGEIPEWIWGVGNGSLIYLNLSCNHLVGLQENYSIQNLAVLDLHSNQLQGKFPTPPLTVTYVDYSSNNFSNSIPLDIGASITFAYFFSLASNSLSGVIPESICTASYLQVLDLSKNLLTGSIPECLFQNMEALGVLNLGSNKLNGPIPDKVLTNCVLKTLDLSRNLIGGHIPGSLINCKLLEVLNVGTNRIEDKFPCKLRNLFSLRVLVLRSNMFWGDLRCETNDIWPNLQIIDIASNKFNGSLSAGCFLTWEGMMKNDENQQSGQDHLRLDFLTLSHFYYQDTVTVTMKGLEVELQKILTVFTSIDFSCNEFNGSIPQTVGDLKALYVLNLSHNALTGAIPNTIGNLAQLGSLDLSRNQLTGTIPSELGNLTFLSFLNLSYNKLSGPIPAGRQIQTFLETSFEGNMGLCGFPLNISCKKNETVPDSSHPSTASSSAGQAEFDWQFIFTGVGFGVGAAIILAPLIVCREGRERCDQYLENLLLMIFPAYRFSYIRYDESKVEAIENFEDDFTEDSDEEDEYVVEDEAFRGRYCVFCTKLDAHRKQALHNPKCNCHTSPIFFPSPTSSSSLLVLCHQNF